MVYYFVHIFDRYEVFTDFESAKYFYQRQLINNGASDENTRHIVDYIDIDIDVVGSYYDEFGYILPIGDNRILIDVYESIMN